MGRVLEARVGGLELFKEDRDLARFWFRSVSSLFIERRGKGELTLCPLGVAAAARKDNGISA